MNDESTKQGFITKHPELFHYTTNDGLSGICKSNALWATYFADLNDSREIQELRTPLILDLTDRLLPVLKRFRKNGSFQIRKQIFQRGGNSKVAAGVAKDWVAILYKTTFDHVDSIATCYITSFCSHANDQDYEQKNGLLSQWRGYGKAGGYCLVFDTEKLLELLSQERQRYFLPYSDLLAAAYSIDGLRRTDSYERLLKISEETIEKSLAKDRNNTAGDLFVPFVSNAATLKHRGFFEEREVRLITIAASQSTVDRIKHHPKYQEQPLKKQFVTESEGRVRRHIEMFGEGFRLPIKRVVVGPSRKQQENYLFAREILSNGIEVTKSATPYIGSASV